MAERVFKFSVAAAAGTTAGNPAVTALTMPPVEVEQVEIVIPRGVNGQAGIAIAVGGNQQIPETLGTYVVRDNDIVRWPLQGYPNTGAWAAWTYNSGRRTHTFEVIFLCRLVETTLDDQLVPTPVIF